MIHDSNNVFKKQIKLSYQDGTGGLAIAIAFDIWSSDQLFIYIIHKSRRHLSFFGLQKILPPHFGGFTIFYINVNNLLILTNHNYQSIKTNHNYVP